MLLFEWVKDKPAPVAHISLDEDDSDEDSLADTLRGGESVGSEDAAARLTIALVSDGGLGGPLGPEYPNGFGLVTTLHDLRAAVSQALEDEDVTGPLNRFLSILSDGAIDHPENVTDIWIEETNYRRPKRGRR